jgi:acyl-CoA reductase-like NAD-dependent aldehyde dehydrogenase
MAGTMMHYLAGGWTASGATMAVTNPFDGSKVGEVYGADAAAFRAAIEAAHGARHAMERMPTSERTRVLNAVADGIERETERFAQMITWESGRAIKDTRAEVGRAVFTFRTAAEEARRLASEFFDLDWLPGMERRYALVRRFPIGVVGAITPFNFPLNLVAHKVAPAIAAGCPVVLKPSSKTPIVALMLTRLLDEVGLPRGAISVLPAPSCETTPLVEDDRVRLLTFTGSPEVGWDLRRRAGRKRVTLELGGNAGCIVHADADLPWAVKRVAYGAFAHAGQSCISVQRVLVHEQLFEAFTSALVDVTRRFKVGDPSRDDTDVGPVVDDEAAGRIAAWLDEATAHGATVLTGGKHNGRLFEPTVLTGVRGDLAICAREAFAPVVLIEPYESFDLAVERVDDSRFGLQAGVFTHDLRLVDRAYRGLDVGGVIVNDVPTFRTDQMPYGGAKDSGVGREGPRYAIEEMTERKLLVVNLSTPS